jgi:hypothetical protein
MGYDYSDMCIYEAQVSVLVTGVDHWSWTAHAFVDTSYHGDDNRESVEYYADSTVPVDPLTAGSHVADTPIWKPREYFLLVLERRMGQVKKEWEQTVNSLLQRIEPYVRVHILNSLTWVSCEAVPN